MYSSGSSVSGAIQTQKSKKFIFFWVFLVMEDELKWKLTATDKIALVCVGGLGFLFERVQQKYI